MPENTDILNDTIEKLADEASYRQLLHVCRDEAALPSGRVLREIVDLCRAVLFPGYYGGTRVSALTIRYHTGVNIHTLHTLLSQQLFAGLCFADDAGASGTADEIMVRAEQLSETFIATLPQIREISATDAKAIFDGDPAAQNMDEVIFCYPGFRAITSYRIARQLHLQGVPFIPRIITEMAHSETGIDIHPGAQIGHHFSIDHGTGTVIGETSIIGNYVRLYLGVSLEGARLPSGENNLIRGVPRHPILEDYVTVYSNVTLSGRIRIGKGATIGGNVWVTKDVLPGEKVN
ncbi:Serine acetyltransferase [Bacteroidales bacterium Barb6]|nr:Serine acetyltransferase [Bacteroidales bacterium Barb6]